MAAVLPPCSIGGTTLTIRKFQTHFFTAEELVRIGTMSSDVLAALRTAIENKENVLISGGTSAGKTTLLNALAAFLPDDRVVLIEDTAGAVKTPRFARPTRCVAAVLTAPPSSLGRSRAGTSRWAISR